MSPLIQIGLLRDGNPIDLIEISYKEYSEFRAKLVELVDGEDAADSYRQYMTHVADMAHGKRMTIPFPRYPVDEFECKQMYKLLRKYRKAYGEQRFVKRFKKILKKACMDPNLKVLVHFFN